MAELRAIETGYKGYRFRSRLEARWAVFFDALGLEWEYEKEGYDLEEEGKYLPDFWVPCASFRYPQAGYWFEIKGRDPSEQEMARLLALAIATKHTSFICRGMPGDQYLFWAHHSGNYGWRGQNGAPGVTPSFALWGELLRWNVRHEDFLRAINDARAARFEHGESPAFRQPHDAEVLGFVARMKREGIGLGLNEYSRGKLIADEMAGGNCSVYEAFIRALVQRTGI